MSGAMPVLNEMCATCPWRPGSLYAALMGTLGKSALTESNRICHSTGSSAIKRVTGNRPALCRGARNLQLAYFKQIGVIKEATDEAWNEALRRAGLPEQTVVSIGSLNKTKS